MVLWAPRIQGPLDLRWDGGVYFVLGTSLAEGRGYRLLNEPGEIEATQYPPLYPLLIAAHQKIVGTNDPTRIGRWLRFTSFLTSLAFVLASYALLQRNLPSPWSFLGATMCALHTSTVFLSDIAFAEIPFALATLAFFLWRHPGRSPMRHDMVAGGLAAAAYLLRTAGLALLMAWVAEAVLQRRTRQGALRVAIALLVIGGWQGRIAAIEKDPSYARPAYPYQRAEYLFYNVSYARNVFLRDIEHPELGKLSLLELSERIATSILTVPSRLGQAVTATQDDWAQQRARLRKLPVLGRVFHKALPDVLLVLVGLVVIGGLMKQVLNADKVMPLYVAAYVGLLCMTPSAWESARYLLPIAPLLVIALWQCVLAVQAWVQRRPRPRLEKLTRLAIVAFVGLILTVQAASLFDLFRDRHQRVEYVDGNGRVVRYRLFYYREAYQALDAGLSWLKEHAKPTEIIVSSMPHWVYLRTGMKAVMPPFETDPRRAQALLESVPATYLIVDGRTGSFTREYGLPAVKASPERWQLIYSSQAGELAIYRRDGVALGHRTTE
jgi:hypothetical protein